MIPVRSQWGRYNLPRKMLHAMSRHGICVDKHTWNMLHHGIWVEIGSHWRCFGWFWTILKQGIPWNTWPACKMASLSASVICRKYPLEMGNDFGWPFGQGKAGWRTSDQTAYPKRWKWKGIILQHKTTERLKISVLKGSFWDLILKHENNMALWRRDVFSIFVDRYSVRRDVYI